MNIGLKEQRTKNKEERRKNKEERTKKKEERRKKKEERRKKKEERRKFAQTIGIWNTRYVQPSIGGFDGSAFLIRDTEFSLHFCRFS
ncbi:hypothetical protein BCT96_022650 [Vibrio splendidus]|uniref:hypothetical protein n=1 Tax=Vibrio splendidus TaxID=29497 RepID=UPI0039A52872